MPTACALISSVALCALILPGPATAADVSQSPPAVKTSETAPSPPARESAKKSERTVHFELTDQLDQGLIAPGKRALLLVRLTGESWKQADPNVVAILECPGMPRTLISMAPGREPSVLEASTAVELPTTTVLPDEEASNDHAPFAPRIIRINATFARLKGMRLEPFLKRRVYLVVGRYDGVAPGEAVPAPGDSEITIHTADPSGKHHEHPPDVPGINEAVVLESDLLGRVTETGNTRNYWRELSDRIKHRWGERHRALRQESQERVSRIRFRLYPTGVAQAIHLERSSGNVRVDVAGLESVVDTMPFLPFPSDVNEPYVDVHVNFRPEPAKR